MSQNEKIDDILRLAFDCEKKGDITTAIKKFKAASRLGSNDARSMLGTIFSEMIPNPNYSRAIYWYKKGVSGGDSSCAWNLAMHYAILGRPIGYKYWINIARKMGDPDAQSEYLTRHWWLKHNKCELSYGDTCN